MWNLHGEIGLRFLLFDLVTCQGLTIVCHFNSKRLNFSSEIWNRFCFMFYSPMVPTSKTFVKTFLFHCIKSVRIRSYSCPHFPAFGQNTERFSVSLRSGCGKIRTRIAPNTDALYAVFSSKTLLIIFENNLWKYMHISIVKVHIFMKNDKYYFSF